MYAIRSYYDPNVLRVFIHAPFEDCVRHEMEYMSCSEKEAKKLISRTDSYRNAYYKYHTGHEWNDARNYDLSLDTGIFTYQECADLIRNFVEFIVSRGTNK